MGLSIKLSENGGRAPEAVPYMPAGESVIDASVNGAPGRRRVVATRETCERLQRDLEEHLKASEARQKARPLVMFDHKTDGGAAAVPLGFEWDDERGILLRVEWTQAGREAVEGGNYGYISPSFRLQRGTGEILGLAGGVEVGSLVNDPAFEGNECIAAGREAVDEVVVMAVNNSGCNQYGHGWVSDCSAGGGGGDSESGSEEPKTPQARLDESKKAMKKANANYAAAIKLRSDSMKKYYDLDNDIDIALKNGDKKTASLLKKDLEEAHKKWNDANEVLKKATTEYDEVAKKYWAAKKEAKQQDLVKTLHEPSLPPRNEVENVGVLVDNKGGSGEGVGAENRNNNKKNMEEIAKLLGLPADADAATICSKIAAMQKESGEAKKRIEEVEAEKEEHKNALHKHKEEAADAFVKRQKNEGKIAPHDKERLEAARAMYLADSANAELIFAGMRRVDNVREDGKVDTADQVQAAAAKNYENLSLAELLAAEK